MKILSIIITAAVVAILALFVVLGRVSKSGQAPGLITGKLSPCPDNPNSVNSELQGDAKHHIKPLPVMLEDVALAWDLLRQAVQESGGAIIADSGDYLAAEYTSTVFGFVDDLEARLDSEAGVINVRSASRVGKSDFGVNAGRVEAIRKRFAAKQQAAGEGG
jgi:uncharacterized protein (DUF1499 family)